MSRLWACHLCKMLGSEGEAEHHMEATGHHIDPIPNETAEALQANVADKRRDRLAALMLLGEMASESVDSYPNPNNEGEP